MTIRLRNEDPIDHEWIVNQIYARCIGCRYCANACPYTVKYFNWRRPVHPPSAEPGLNPDVSVRPVGVIEKCTFCSHRLQRARDQARIEKRGLRETDYVPACAESCPTGAITFGDLTDPTHRVAQLARDPRVFFLHGHIIGSRRLLNGECIIAFEPGQFRSRRVCKLEANVGICLN